MSADLTEPFVVDWLEFGFPLLGNLGHPLEIDRAKLHVIAPHVSFVPYHRPECIPLVLQCERMAGPMYLGMHEPVGHRQRPIPIIDRAGDLLDRATVCIDRVPQTQKLDFFNRNQLVLVQWSDEKIAQPAKRLLHAGYRMKPPAVLSIGCVCLRRQIALVAAILYKTHICDQTGDDPDRERAATEAETVDSIARIIVAATKAVDVDHIAHQAEPEDAAENGEQLERRGADAVIVIGDLPGGLGEIERLKHPPDVGLEQLCRAIAGTVRQQDNILRRSLRFRIFRHGCPRPKIPLVVYARP